MKTQRAFTIIELMATMAIAAIVLTIAVPAMQDMVRNNRLVTQTNLLVSHIQLARSEAIKRNRPVILCRSANPRAANPTCGGGTANDWTTGWLVFVDNVMTAPTPPDTDCILNPNGNGIYDPNTDEDPDDGVDDDANECIDDTDVLIRIGEPPIGGITIMSNAAAEPRLQYDPNGTLNGGAGVARFAVCDGRDDPETAGRRIQIALTGRPSLTVGTVAAPLLPSDSCDSP